MGKVGRWVHELILFLGYGQGNQWKTGLFCKLLRIRKFSMGKCFGASAHGILRHGKNFNNFYPVLVAWSRVSATKCGPLTKIWAVAKKYIFHNFWNWALKLKSLLPIVYGKKWFKKGQVTVLQKNYQIKAVKNYLHHTGHSLSGVHLGRSVLCGNHLDVK